MTYKRPAKVVQRRYDTEPLGVDTKDDAGSAYMGLIAQLRCIVCKELGVEQEGRTYVHHLREGQGMGKRASSFLVMPLCYEHHQGKTGIHGDRSLMRLLKMEEIDLLSATIEQLIESGKLEVV